MKIEKYIAQLLYRHQCVIVPGLGAFLSEIQSVEWIEATNTFIPPKKVISFNSYLKNNDGLLANTIALAENIDYNEAVSLIENEVNQLKIKLEQQEQISIESIGTLAKNENNKIVFAPSVQTNFHTQSFGLTTFVSPSIKRSEITEQTEPQEKQPLETPKTNMYQPKPYLKYAALIALSLGTIATVGYLGYTNYTNSVDAQTLIVQQKVQQKVNQKIQEATFGISNPLPTVTISTKKEIIKQPYHIVAGAFKNHENATKICNELKQKGYPARILNKNKNGYYNVFYASYSNLKEAQDALQSIKNSHSKEAWLFTQEL